METAAPVEPVAPVAVVVGEVVSAEQAGTLPEAVKADIAAPTIAASATIGEDTQADGTPLHSAVAGSVARVSGQTGRSAVVIVKVADAFKGWIWNASGAAVMKPPASSEAEITAHVQAWNASQPNPAEWEIIDAAV